MTAEVRGWGSLLTAITVWAIGVALFAAAETGVPDEATPWLILVAAAAMVLAQRSPWQFTWPALAVRVAICGAALGISGLWLARTFDTVVTELPSGYLPRTALLASIGLGLCLSARFSCWRTEGQTFRARYALRILSVVFPA